MKDETRAARMERLLRTLPPAVRGMGFGDPDDDDEEYTHASEVVSWAISEIDRLREERRWIPVEERLPEVGSSVLVAWSHEEDKNQAISQAWYDPLGKFMSLEDMEFPNVTHWQPLPAPPSEGEVEG